MKKFFLQLLVFSLPIIILAYPLDVFLSKYLKASEYYAESEYVTWNALFDGNVNSDMVIYGASRAMVQIDPAIITDSLHIPVFNLGIDGHSFPLQYFRHTLLMKNNVKPKIIISSLDVFTLENRVDLYNGDQFLPYMLLNKPVMDATINYKGYNWLDYKLPLIRYYGKSFAIKSALRLFFLGSPNIADKRIRGYSGQNQTWNNDLDNAKNSLAYYKVKIDTTIVSQFEKFLTDCKNRNIRVVLLYSPEYIEGQKFVKNRAQVMALYTRFSKKYNIPFYDYSNDTMSYQQKYFYNTEHLNKTGAELFTKRLVDTLKKSAVLNGIVKGVHN